MSVSLAKVMSGYVPGTSTVPASGLRLMTAPPAFNCAFWSTASLSVVLAPMSKFSAELLPAAPPSVSVTVPAPLLLPRIVKVPIAPSVRSIAPRVAAFVPPATVTVPPVALVVTPMIPVDVPLPDPPSELPPFTDTAVAPSAPVTITFPPEITVGPVNVFVPPSVCTPAPIFAKPPVPETTPENAVEVPSLPVVSVADPSVTLPAPASEPTF